MVYNSDPRVAQWFEAALRHHNAEVRLAAVGLLREVDAAHRDEWLATAENDTDPLVVAEAVIVRAEPVDGVFEFYESELASALPDDDLIWEWEYMVRVTQGLYVPAAATIVWTRAEDDITAAEMALLKALRPGAERDEAVPIIVGKRLVNQYTRSARNMNEAIRWHYGGRPRYGGG